MISLAQLIAAGVTPTQARAFSEPLSIACGRFGITTPKRVAMFVAQANHESNGFARLEESLMYSTPLRIVQVWPSQFTGLADAARYVREPQKLAAHVYAGRLGNGDEASGDGWKYRGRGLFQLTGRDNYMAAANGVQRSYDQSPELVTLPLHAALTAAWFWATLDLNDAAERGDVVAVTRAINGKAMLGLDERREMYGEAVRAFA